MHTVKKDAYISVSFISLFLVCCLVMLIWGHQMNSPVLVIPFMIVWGLSALLWPAFALRSLRRYMRRNG